MKKLTLLLSLLLLFSGISSAQYSTTPIMLSLPMDADTIEEDEPLLVWQTTLSNLENDPRLNVRLSVVQVGEDQTPSEAILENSPVFMRQNLLSNSINYSEIDHELVEGTWYAWQVVLLYNGVQVQQSEVFKFIKAYNEPAPITFYVIKTKADNSLLVVEDEKFYLTVNDSKITNRRATISGKNMTNQQIDFIEIEANGDVVNDSELAKDRHYYKCDISGLDLPHGKYRIQWNATESLEYILFIKK